MWIFVLKENSDVQSILSTYYVLGTSECFRSPAWPKWWEKKADLGYDGVMKDFKIRAAHLSWQDSISETVRLHLGLFITKPGTL